MESSHIATLQLPGSSKQARQIHIFPKIKTAPLIFLRVLLDNVCITKLYKQDMSVQNNEQQIIKFTRNNKTVIWEVTLETQQSEVVVNNIMDQTTKP